MVFRKTHKTSREVTASVELNIRQPDEMRYLTTVLSASRSYGALPWKWYDGIGEVHYGVSRGARVAGYARLRAVELGKDGRPIRDARGLPADIVDEIQSPYGGQRGLLDRFFTLSKIPGDSYLVECREGSERVGYDVLDADEIEMDAFTDGTRKQRGEVVFPSGVAFKRVTHPFHGVRDSMGNGSEKLVIDFSAEQMLGRIWRPSARYVDVADSPMRSNETTCELLYLLTKHLKAKITSRLALNGIIYVPTEINQIRTGTPGGGEDKMLDGTTMDRLIRAASWAIVNFDDPRAAIPIFASGPAQFADALKHIVMDQQIYETDMKLRMELIDRLLMGLDVQPQDVRGVGDSNHWSAWAVNDDERRININPELETFCWAATRMILHRRMAEAGLQPGRIAKTAVWYDLTDANVKTNLAEDARQAGDRLWIPPSAGRKMTGISEEFAPTDEEYVRMLGVKTGDPYLATYGLDVAKKIDWDKVVAKAPPGPDAEQPAGKPPRPRAGTGTPDDSDSNTPRKLRPA